MRTIIIILISFATISAQQFTVRGKIQSSSTGELLYYASVRVDGTVNGTTSNSEGKYELKLKSGHYKLIATYIGYTSDTLNISLNANSTYDFKLEPVGVNIPEITVLPEDNPAYEVIRRAISAKHEREKFLNDYSFKTYTKAVIKVEDKEKKDSTAAIKDSMKMEIAGIIENEGKGYFKKPNEYKDEIIARKQTANLPPQLNVFTGGRIIQNFYTDDIQFFDRPLLSPIADEAIDYYYYKITDTLSIDKINVFKISFSPKREADPGFIGDVYIADDVFALVKIDLSLNSAANMTGLLKKTKIVQQFSPFTKNIYMPIDYRLYVEANILGLITIGFDLNTIFHEYEINKNIPDDFFGMTIVKVMPGADKKDSLYWANSQTIPNTRDEIATYRKIDSIKALPVNILERLQLLTPVIIFNENYSMTGPMALYDFNKVEGNALHFNFNGQNLLDYRLKGGVDFRYGFADKIFKKKINLTYGFGEFRSDELSFTAYDWINSLFPESDRYSEFISSILNLFFKEDVKDYYYSKGFNLNFASDILPILRLGVGFNNRTDITASKNSDYSFLGEDKKYEPNRPVYDTKINALTFNFALDFRKFIEDGYFRQKIDDDNFSFYLNGKAFLSKKNLLGSSHDFGIYELSLNGNVTFLKRTTLTYSINGLISDNSIPFQYLYTLPGNVKGLSLERSFRTLGMKTSIGDRALTAHFEYNVRDELFRRLGIPLLQDWNIFLAFHFNAGWIDLTDNSKMPSGYDNDLYTTPLIEAGFGIGQQIVPLRLEFTWRLTHRNENDFVLSMNFFMF